MSSHVFISYSHKDSDFVHDTLKTNLPLEKFDLWIDEERLHAGEKWRDEIENAIRTALAVIVIITPDSKASEYVTYEWAFAWGAGIPVIPILLKDTELHKQLENLHHLDFTNRQARPWDQLIERIESKKHILSSNEFPLITSSMATNTRDLFEKLFSDDDLERFIAIDYLVADGETHVSLLLRFLQSDDWRKRRYAAMVLGEIKYPSTVQSLGLALYDSDRAVRRAVEEALMRIGTKEAMDWLNGWKSQGWNSEPDSAKDLPF